MRFGPDVQWIPMAALGDEDYRVDPARAAPFAEAIRAYWPALPDAALLPAYAGILYCNRIVTEVFNAG
jgi:hypothetical protein